MIDVTRRGFLAGLGATVVIAALPPANIEQPPILDPLPPPSPTPPSGMTYNWVRTALMGEPDIENVEQRINEGWSFVIPASHPEMPASKVDVVLEQRGLILMQKPTVEVELDRVFNQFVNRHKLPDRYMVQVFHSGYVVSPKGEIIGPDGNPFAGTVAPEHMKIAIERARKHGQESAA